MRKFKILFLMLLGIFGLNSCVALGVAAGVGYAVPWIVAISCSEFGVCSEPKSRTPKQIERDEKLKLKKEIEEKNYIQNTILSKRKNKEIFENISILMPEKLEFRKVKEPREYEYSNVISELYDKEKKNLFLQRLFIVEKDKKDFEKIINDGKDEKYKEYYEKEKAEYKLRLLSTDVEKIGENAYKITEKLEMSNEPIVKITYVKILKEGVYVIGNENSKDIFLALFGK